MELPGYDDQESAIAALGKTAQLTMSDEHGNVIITGAELKRCHTLPRQLRASGRQQ